MLSMWGDGVMSKFNLVKITNRTLELCCAYLLSCVQLFATPCTVSPPGQSVHGDSLGKNMSGYALLQGIFPTQRSNLVLPHGSQILYCLNHHWSPDESKYKRGSVVQSPSHVWLFVTPWTANGFPVHHQFLKLAQTHVHWVSNATQPSHPLSPPCPRAFNLSQHHGFLRSQLFASGG